MAQPGGGITDARPSVPGTVRRGLDPRVKAERSRTLLARAAASCWVAFAIIPFTILTYDAAFFPSQLARGAAAAGVADALILLLLLALRRGLFDRVAWMPFALLAGVICNATEAVNVMLTGGPLESNFIFPYHVVSFGIAVLFPGPIAAVLVTAALLPLGYLGLAVALHEPLHAQQLVSNLMVLADSAGITVVGNIVVTRIFLREVQLRIDLEDANKQLRDLDRLKSEFFANVSHELRTPLTLILAPAASLARDTQGAQHAMVETIQRNATRQLHLINDLLLLAKLESGEPLIHRVPVDVSTTARRIVEEAEAYAHALHLHLELSAADPALIWNGDERHLERILLNLVSNACKFSKPGGTVQVAVESEGGGIALRVTDHGIGIAESNVDKIFERFVQLESSARRRFEGTGIGLSIVKQLVTLHGGSVRVESELGMGSTFHVHLPSAIRSAGERSLTPTEMPVRLVPPALPQPAAVTASDGPRIMIVEDNTDLLNYLTHELGRWYRVMPFADSVKALETALADPPDLILSDIMMPAMDGIALAREVRSDPRTIDLPVVLLSAREEVEAKLAGFEAGADDYVQKPFELSELRARIHLHLHLRSKSRLLSRALEQLKQAESSLVQSEKMVALGRMVAGVAHEMNNPLHFLRGNFTLLRRRVAADAALAPLFADMEESLDRMTSVTRQLLLFGRKHGEGAAEVKLSDVVPLVLKMVAPQTPAGVRIVQQIDGESVRANPQDLFQILLNVVHNALQAVSPTGGEVRIASTRAGDKVELSIADNGCGIAKENLSRIFDPFFTTKPVGVGTGLGLSIVQQLVSAQQGTVRVESELGHGTTVSLLLQSAGA